MAKYRTQNKRKPLISKKEHLVTDPYHGDGVFHMANDAILATMTFRLPRRPQSLKWKELDKLSLLSTLAICLKNKVTLEY